MGKKPTPKQKKARSLSRKRYGAYATKQRNKISDRAATVKCGKCGEARLPHTVCQNCGTYRGRQVIKLDVMPTTKKVRRVKA